MGYSNYNKVSGTYCTRRKCPIVNCKHHVNQTKQHSSQSGIEYTVAPIYKDIDCPMAKQYRKELKKKG